MDFDHNRLIADVAKQVLFPAGLKRKGKSRLYFDDNGWWCTIVEFQPSGFSKGSYLNVGVSWLLYQENGWSFSVGYRQQEFSEANDEIEFSNAVFEMATSAKEIVESNRELFSTVFKAHEYYESIKREGWNCYYAAVIAGLSGHPEIAERNFNSLFNYPETTAWQKELNLRSRELMLFLGQPEKFLSAVSQIVLNSRDLRRLEKRDPASLGLLLTA